MEQILQEEIEQIRLPKNVRQIGSIDKETIIYIEDYVVTYLEQMTRKEKLQFGAAALYGRTILQQDLKYIFISAAVFEEDRPALQTGPNDVIENGPTEAMLSVFYENEEKYFAELSPVGVAVIHSDSVRIPDAWTRKNKMEGLLGCGLVMIDLVAGGDGADYYLYNEDGVALQDGYYIYYEKNDIMQSFLVEWHENAQTGLSEEPLDYVAGTCRMVMEDKKEDKLQERSVNWMSASGLLGLIIVSAIGIMVMNHYDVDRDDSMTARTDVALESEQTEQPAQTDSGSQPTRTDLENPNRQEVSLGQDNPDSQGGELPLGVDVAIEPGGEPDGNMAENMQQPSDEGEISETPDDENLETSAAISTEVDSPEDLAQNTPREYMIEKGDTLYEISRRYYGTVSKVPMICEYNQIEDQDSIFYGQTIILP